jgi:hypothetical protein
MRFLQTGPISNRLKVAIIIHLVFFLYWFVAILFATPVAVEPSYFILPPFYWLWFFLFFPQVTILYLVAGDTFEHASFVALFFGLLAAFPISYLYSIVITKIFQRLARRVPKTQETHNVAV